MIFFSVRMALDYTNPPKWPHECIWMYRVIKTVNSGENIYSSLVVGHQKSEVPLIVGVCVCFFFYLSPCLNQIDKTLGINAFVGGDYG